MNADSLKKPDVAIIGAGYAGASAARALSLLGCKVTVYEQAREIREVGAGIGLRPSTMDQFRKLGIYDAINAVTSPSNYFEVLTAHGQRIAMEEWPEKAAFNATTHFVHRGDFIDALVGVLPAGMVKVGHRLSRITDDGDRATCTFDNGVSVTADLVVGADGIRSQVRAQLFSNKPPVFAGEHAYRAVIPASRTAGLVADGNLRMYMGRGTKIYVLPLLHRDEVSFDVTCLAADSTPAPTASKEQLLKVVQGFDERLVAIAAGLDMAQVNVRDMDATLASTPAVLLSSGAPVSREFEIKTLPDSEGLNWYELRPRQQNGDFLAARIGFAKGELRRMLLADKLNQLTRLDFSNAVRNQPLPDSLFTFSPPAGVDIIGGAPAAQP